MVTHIEGAPHIVKSYGRLSSQTANEMVAFVHQYQAANGTFVEDMTSRLRREQQKGTLSDVVKTLHTEYYKYLQLSKENPKMAETYAQAFAHIALGYRQP